MDQSKDLGEQHTNVTIPDQNDVQATGVMVGSGTKDSKNSFRPNKWMGLAAFALLFGGIGSYLLFGSKAGVLPNGEIFLGTNVKVTPDGGVLNEVKLPADAQPYYEAHVTASHDGMKVAYFASATKQLKVVSVSTGTVLNTISYTPATYGVSGILWSPDNTKLLVDGSYVDLATGAAQPAHGNVNLSDWASSTEAVAMSASESSLLIGNMVGDWSPRKVPLTGYPFAAGTNPRVRASVDGTKVAIAGIKMLSGGGYSQQDLYSANIDGTGVKKIATGQVDYFTWSSDGTQLVYSISGKLYIVNADGAGARQLDTGMYYSQTSSVEWPSLTSGQVTAPPASTKAIPHRNGRIYSSLEMQYNGFLDFYKMSSVQLSPVNGVDYAYIPQRSCSGSPLVCDKVAEVRIRQINGLYDKLIVRLPNKDLGWFLAGWSPNGRELALMTPSNSVTYQAFDIWTMNADGTGLTKRFTTNRARGNLVWRQDSASVLWADIADGQTTDYTSRICTQFINGYKLDCFTVPGIVGSLLESSYAPTDKYLAVRVKSTDNTKETIYVIDLVSRTTMYTKQFLATNGRLLSMQWSPDGTKLAYSFLSSDATSTASGVYTMNPDGTALQKVNNVADSFIWQALPVTTRKVFHDYGGDGYADTVGYVAGSWHGLYPSDWGSSEDILVPADYNGDGSTDRAYWHPSNATWYVRDQQNIAFGMTGDIPVPADYNGDGKAELAVWRPLNRTWYARGGVPANTVCGAYGDIPVPADYNGDGKAEFAVYRPGNQTFYKCGGSSLLLGAAGDIPVPADYNGDGKAEFAVYRPGTNTYYVSGGQTITVGAAGDIPVPADYNGDGKADFATVAKNINSVNSRYRFSIDGQPSAFIVAQPAVLPYTVGNYFGDSLNQTNFSAVNNIANTVAVNTLGSTEIYTNVSLYTGTRNVVHGSLMLSPNKKYALLLQQSGAWLSLMNLTTYATKDLADAFYSTPYPNFASLRLSSTGNLVLSRKALASDPWTVAWQTATSGKGATSLRLEDTGNLVLRDSAGTAIWSSNTAGKY